MIPKSIAHCVFVYRVHATKVMYFSISKWVKIDLFLIKTIDTRQGGAQMCSTCVRCVCVVALFLEIEKWNTMLDFSWSLATGQTHFMR